MSDCFDDRQTTDLACERRKADLSLPGVAYAEETRGGLRWERLRILSAEGEKSIGRPKGTYLTLTVPRMDGLDEGEKREIAQALADKLTDLSQNALGKLPESLLVVGLGNEALTPDAVGPLTARAVHATMHVKETDEAAFRAWDCAAIAVLTPGVTAQSGMDAAETVAAVCRKIKPDLVIAVDALAARATERLGCTVQLSDTGISPGSGVGNHRIALNEKTVGAPVLAVGVPTVTDSRVFFAEEAERRGLSGEVDWTKAGMFVSPKEIGEIADGAADLIGSAINTAFGVCL